jgi:hypothetical protein
MKVDEAAEVGMIDGAVGIHRRYERHHASGQH